MHYGPVTLSSLTIGQEQPKTISLSNGCTKTFIRIDKADTLFIGIYEKNIGRPKGNYPHKQNDSGFIQL